MWRSQSFENGCLYSIYKEKADFISYLIRCGDEYLHTHHKILMDFTYWNFDAVSASEESQCAGYFQKANQAGKQEFSGKPASLLE